jgi:hypothetical protein
LASTAISHVRGLAWQVGVTGADVVYRAMNCGDRSYEPLFRLGLGLRY